MKSLELLSKGNPIQNPCILQGIRIIIHQIPCKMQGLGDIPLKVVAIYVVVFFWDRYGVDAVDFSNPWHVH